MDAHVRAVVGSLHPWPGSAGVQTENGAGSISCVCSRGTPTKKRDECRPWDEKDFFKRVSTYTLRLWFNKSDLTSPIECARYGWHCVAVDVLGCGCCDARIRFETPEDLPATRRRQLEEDFKRRLVSAHKVFCGWKTNHCAEDISHFPRLKSVVLEEFKKRLKSWEGPNVFPVLDDDFLREWLEEEAKHSEHLGAPSSAAAILAYCGWGRKANPSSETAKLTIECMCCFRQVGLWNFKAQISNSNRVPDPPSDEPKPISPCKADFPDPECIPSMFRSRFAPKDKLPLFGLTGPPREVAIPWGLPPAPRAQKRPRDLEPEEITKRLRITPRRPRKRKGADTERSIDRSVLQMKKKVRMDQSMARSANLKRALDESLSEERGGKRARTDESHGIGEIAGVSGTCETFKDFNPLSHHRSTCCFVSLNGDRPEGWKQCLKDLAELRREETWERATEGSREVAFTRVVHAT